MAVQLKILWKSAKLRFEGLTGKKKPSAKLLGVFKKSSGLEGAFEDIDKAAAAFVKKVEELKDAHAKVRKQLEGAAVKAEEYITLVKDGISDEDEDDYLDALKGLRKDIKILIHTALEWVDAEDPETKGY